MMVMMSRKGSVGSTRSNSTISVSSNPARDGNGSGPGGGDNGLLACSAAVEHVLYAQGGSVAVLRQGSLALERRFDGHGAGHAVSVIAVDNRSDGQPTRVVSVDTGRTAIIWSLETGAEISRFVAYDDLQTAAWMKNGNLAFGSFPVLIHRNTNSPILQFPIPIPQFPIPNPQSPIPDSQFPILNSQFSIPNSQFPIPNSQFPIPNSQFPIPNSQSPIPNSQFPIPNS